MSDRPTIVVSVTVVTDDPEQVTRTGEAFNRAAAGLALDGISVSVDYGIPNDDDTEGQPE